MVKKVFKNIYKKLSQELELGNEVAMLTFLKPTSDKKGAITDKYVLVKDNLENDSFFKEKDKVLKQNILNEFETGYLQIINTEDENILIEPYFPNPRLVIFGGGHIAKPLVEFGAKVGFSVAVVDDRLSFANPGRFPHADEVICESFEKSFSRLNIRKSDFVVIVTRGHRHDGVCLRHSLGHNPAYIGMIGSRRRVKGVKDELLKEGYSQEKLDKVYSPIGVDINAVTPEEIAISIIAEVISVRRARKNAFIDGNIIKFNWPEFDGSVIDEMSKESDIPRALITIISSKGSVPRKAGAKMIVWLDGKTIGSIGGGCSEADIITLSRNIIQNKGYAIEHIDMTGDVAEDEGMVCGGIMDVLIEAF